MRFGILLLTGAVATTSTPAITCTNVPVAVQTLFSDDFESGTLSAWEDVTGMTVTSVSGEVYAGTYAAKQTFALGSNSAGWIWRKHLCADNSAQTEMYFRWYHKWSAGWVWNATAGGDQKIMMLEALEPQDGWGQTANWKVYVHTVGLEHAATGVEVNELVLDTFIWDGTNQWSGQWQYFPQNQTKVLFTAGQWYKIEVGVIHNTPGVANGTLRVWIDDTLVMEYTGVKFRDDPINLNAMYTAGWYQDGVPQLQYAYIDDVTVTTARLP